MIRFALFMLTVTLLSAGIGLIFYQKSAVHRGLACPPGYELTATTVGIYCQPERTR